MSLKYIRNYYQVPAKRGQRIKFQGREGMIATSRGPHLRVRFNDDLGHLHTIHPTWEVEYLTKNYVLQRIDNG